jgi:3-oxoacyl-[acyl-carrier protein] reductase
MTRVAIVTGASRGIGAATALRLARDGCAVALAARSVGDLEGVAREIEAAGGTALVAPTDASDPDALSALVDRTVQELGRLDVLVNNAGVLPKARRAERFTVEDFTATMGVNLMGPWWLACRAKEAMAAGGCIVNVTSSAAFFPGIGLSLYSTSKAALGFMTRVLALEWAHEGIRVVGVAPGKVDTLLGGPVIDYGNSRPAGINPLGRVGTPEEIAELIAYVASDRASFMTGTTVQIDGGEVLAPDNSR